MRNSLIKKEKTLAKSIAYNRIKILFLLSIKNIDDLNYSIYLVKQIKKLSTHYKVKLRPEIKNKICKKCNLPLIPGKTTSIRISKEGFILYTCLNCGTKKRIFLNKKKDL
jgi:RNase P subunit RPR2